MIPTLFVLGDSVSIGYGTALARLVQGRFAYRRKEGTDEALRNLDIPQGANGGDSSMCLAYLRSWRDHGIDPADILLLNCGLHDLKVLQPSGQFQVPIRTYEQNLRQIIALAPAVTRHLVWIRTTPIDEPTHNRLTGCDFHRYNADIDVYNIAADRVMREHGLPVIDLHAFSANLGPCHRTLHDGRHYHEPFCDQQGAFIAGWLTAWWHTVTPACKLST